MSPKKCLAEKALHDVGIDSDEERAVAALVDVNVVGKRFLHLICL